MNFCANDTNMLIICVYYQIICLTYMVSYTYSGITSEDSYSNEPHSGIVLVEGIEVIKSEW
jgi:hypothetical protein